MALRQAFVPAKVQLGGACQGGAFHAVQRDGEGLARSERSWPANVSGAMYQGVALHVRTREQEIWLAAAVLLEGRK